MPMSHSSSLMLLAAALLAAGPLRAQDPPAVAPDAPSTTAARATASIRLDGSLEEPAWAAAPATTGLLQREPAEGEAATQRTEVRFLYDDEALYVGARMYDELGAAGVRSRLVRRDADSDADFFGVELDTYHDHVGYSGFYVNPAGTRSDELNGDSSWDPIWEARTQIDSLGWTAELRIPFSQLRYPRVDRQTWGLQIVRQVTRLNERSTWAFWRQNEFGGPARFGHLENLEIRRAPSSAEILPYAVAQSSHRPPGDVDNPFDRPSLRDYRVGVDLKYLLTSNLTLSAAINPDFGQVEVDPAVVNLSAYETFFPERRPFFVEGSDYFGFGDFWCMFCSNVSSLGLFYSRRIGRAPQGASLAQDAGEFADVPNNSTILGAAKITGKTRNGWSIAMLDAVTGEETAEVVDGAERFTLPVEPLTNYFVTRVKRDAKGGNLVFGGMATATHRDLPTSDLASRLTSNAQGLGVDSEIWWKNRTYHFLASAAVSRVSGDAEAIRRVQESSARYFQRPDREHGGNGVFHDAYDAGLTEMRGYGLYSRIAKDGGDWGWEAATNIRSPGFEANDIAFLTRTDYIWNNANVMRRFTKPNRYFRRSELIVGGQQQMNFDGDVTGRQLHGFAAFQFPNYWNFSTFHIRRLGTLDDRMTRGGPLVRREGDWRQFFNLSTDARRAVVLSANPTFGETADGYRDYSVNLGLQLRPRSNVTLSLGPSYSHGTSPYQYVTDHEDPTATGFFGRRYVFADLKQQGLSMETRLAVTFTPAMSLEVFAQPYISSGHYSRFKEFAAPRSSEMLAYGEQMGTIAAVGSGEDREYEVDPDGSGPADPFTFADPDFNFRSLRGNAVLRWEYLPGSTLFLVWTQDRSHTGPDGDLRFGRDRNALFDAKPTNIFLIKVNYWLGL
jgi:hypothetical protein